MKKILSMIVALIMIASITACGEQKNQSQDGNVTPPQNEQTADQNQGSGNDNQNTTQNGQGSTPGDAQNNAAGSQVSRYDEHDIQFDVPEQWKNNFKATYQEHGNGDTAYTSITYTTRIGQNDVTVMTIAAFGESQWENIKKSSADAEKMKIGTSKDGKTHYTLRIEDQKFENEAEQKAFDTIRDAAKKLEGKIKITK